MHSSYKDIGTAVCFIRYRIICGSCKIQCKLNYFFKNMKIIKRPERVATNSVVLTHWTLMSMSGCFGVESTMFKIQKGKKWKVDLQHQLNGHFFENAKLFSSSIFYFFACVLNIPHSRQKFINENFGLSSKTFDDWYSFMSEVFLPFLEKSRTVRWRNPRSGNWWGDSERGSITKEGEWRVSGFLDALIGWHDKHSSYLLKEETKILYYR